MLTMSKVSKGETRQIDEFLFVYFPSHIKIWTNGQDIDSIELSDGEVTTTQHFEEKIMWWMHEWNVI